MDLNGEVEFRICQNCGSNPAFPVFCHLTTLVEAELVASHSSGSAMISALLRRSIMVRLDYTRKASL